MANGMKMHLFINQHLLGVKKMNKLNVFAYFNYPWKSFHGFIQNILTIPKICKYMYQRNSQGYCDRDLWGLSDYYKELLYQTLTSFATKTHTYPGRGEFSDEVAKNEGYIDDVSGCHGALKWSAYLLEAATHFYKANCDHEDIYPTKESLDLFDKMIDAQNTKQAETARKEWIMQENADQETRTKELNAGFEMLLKYFDDLWD